MEFDQAGLVWEIIIPGILVVISMMTLCRWLANVSGASPEQLIGVTPKIRPFESRAEFEKARMEMDLDEFLERVHVTPISIKGGRPEVRPGGNPMSNGQAGVPWPSSGKARSA